MPRPAKRARVEQPHNTEYAHQEEDADHEDDVGEEDDEDDGVDDDTDDLGDHLDADGDPEADADGDREAQALVDALGGSGGAGRGEPGQQAEQEQHEHIVDYCYRMGYFPANERFPNAVTANRFRAAPLRPQRTLNKNPLTRRSWHPQKPANWCAVLLQCGGQEVSEACTRCVDGQGFWVECVVPNDWATSWITRGACANCYMDGKRGNCSRGFGLVVSPHARGTAAATVPTVAAAPASSSEQSRSTTAAPFTATQAQTASTNLTNQDFESLKRQYNRMSTSDLDKLAEQSAAERARISLQLAAIDAVRAAREAFTNQQATNGTHAV